MSQDQETAQPAEGTTAPPEAAAAAPAPEAPAAPTDVPTVVNRISKMQNKVVQDVAAVTAAMNQMAAVVQDGFGKLQLTFAMLTKQVATNDVKADNNVLELRKQFSGDMTELAKAVQGVITDRVVERVTLAVADALDDAITVIQNTPDNNPSVQALRLVCDKLFGGLASLGVGLVQIAPGQTVFDERVHEFAGHAPAEDKAPAHAITKIVKQGYAVNGRLVRRAAVIIKGA